MGKKSLPPDIICWCKGWCNPNPGGIMSYSLVIEELGDLNTVTWIEDMVSDNNESTTYRAYFYAIRAALIKAIDIGYADKIIELRTDLKGAVNQFVQWAIFDGLREDYTNLYMQSDILKEIIALKHKFNRVRINWVSKERMPIQKRDG